MIRHLALQLSETLGFMSLMAIGVVCYRLARLADGLPAMSARRITDLSQRQMFLVGFGLYMAGAVMREGVVMVAGPSQWDDNTVMFSAISRVIQVAGASLYVRAATKPIYGEAAWMIILALSIVFSIASPR